MIRSLNLNSRAGNRLLFISIFRLSLFLNTLLFYFQPKSFPWRNSPRSSSWWSRARSGMWNWPFVRMHGQCIRQYGRSCGRRCVDSTRREEISWMDTIGTWWIRWVDYIGECPKNWSLIQVFPRSLEPQNYRINRLCCRRSWTRDTACHITWHEREALWLTGSWVSSATGVHISRTVPPSTPSRPSCCTLCQVSEIGIIIEIWTTVKNVVISEIFIFSGL